MKDKELNRPRWYSIKEAAEYLDIGEPTLYRWMREGTITFRKVGDSTRFLQEDLDSAIEVHLCKRDADKSKTICPVCRHDMVVEGRLQSTGRLYFRPKSTKFWTFKDSNIEAQGQMCMRCGAITLFGSAEKLQALATANEETS